MRAKILSITPRSQHQPFYDVVLTVGDETVQGRFNSQPDYIGELDVWLLSPDKDLVDRFRRHQDVMSTMTQLVSRINLGEKVTLPAVVGEQTTTTLDGSQDRTRSNSLGGSYS